MKGRGNMFRRLRRWARRGGRSVLGLAVVAYVAAGVAPCVAAAVSGVEVARAHEHSGTAHDHAAQPSVGTEAASHHDHGPPRAATASSDDTGRQCPHCPVRTDDGDGALPDDGHSSCAALQEVQHVAAPHAKESVQPAPALLGPAAFAWPPPLAAPPSAPAPSSALRGVSVPLNVRHCVYLI